MKKALYRKRICAEKEKLTPEKVFHTPQYRDLLTSIGREDHRWRVDYITVIRR